MNDIYSDAYRGTDFSKHPKEYRIGRGEQGVLIVEPYKSEILPLWRFRTPAIATKSAKKIYDQFLGYIEDGDFVGADMARKFLQMGWTRSRRYANHSSGHKYSSSGDIKEQDSDSEGGDKAESAKIFFEYYQKAKDNQVYLTRKKAWQKQEKELLNGVE